MLRFWSWLRRLSRAVRRQATILVGAGFLIVVILSAFGAFESYLRNAQIEDASRGAKRLAAVLAYQTDQSLQSALSSVSKVVARLEATGAATVDALNFAGGAEETQAFLREAIAENQALDSLFVVGADGRIDGSGSASATLAELHGEDHLWALRHASSATIYVSSPYKSSLTGTWQITLSKRVSAGDGAFLGLVSGVVKLTSLADLLEKLSLGEHGSASVIRDDGEIIACFPQRELTLGSDIVDSDLYRSLISKNRDGVTRQISDVDHVERMFAVVNSDRFPVASVIAVAMSDVLADWSLQSQIHWFGAGFIVLAIAFGSITLALHIEQLADAREREAVQRQLAIQYKRFNNAMDNIVQGLAMYDRSGALVACNKRYAEIYGLPVDGKHPGKVGASVPGAAEGRFGKIVSNSRLAPDGSALTISELADGRIIAQRKKGLSDGGWVSTHEDITSARRAEDKIKEMATLDALTGLSNRFDFKQRLAQCLAEARRRTAKFAVLYLDLDHFKAVNDTFGHPVGDTLLEAVATRIKSVVRRSDTIARLGGDEFAIIQRVSNIPRDAILLADRLLASVGKPYSIDGKLIDIGTSIGISTAPEDSVDPDEILRTADMALYQSKATRGCYTFFTASMDEQFRLRRKLDSDLRTALAEEQFELYFQPVVSVMDRQPTSFEALLRWRHPERGILSPDEFIPLAEENGLIVPLGEWALRTACREAAGWPAHIRVAVNVSALQFRVPTFLRSVSEAIRAGNMTGSRLIVEVTESVMVKDAEQVVSTLHIMREMGIAIAMDDFGTGYSSLNYLRRFPFDKIKIDKSFIAELGQREDSTAIVRAATSLARALGMKTVAEGIETEDQLSRVRIEGCSEAQGYLMSPPMPAREVLAFLGVEPDPEGKTRPSQAAIVATEISRSPEKVTPLAAWRNAAGTIPRAPSMSAGMRPGR